MCHFRPLLGKLGLVCLDILIESFMENWWRWYPERWNRAKFLIAGSAVAPESGDRKVVAQFPYRGVLSGEERVYM